MKRIIGLFMVWLIFIVLATCSNGGGSSYSVTYDGNGNTSGTVPVDETVYHEGDTVTVLYNYGNLEKSLYTFTGWNTQADKSGTPYSPGDTFVMGTADVTLYAEWGWTRELGAPGALSEAHGIAVDSSGNSYAVGFTQGNFDGQSMIGTTDCFVTKHNSQGVKQWTNLLGLAETIAFGYGITVDSADNSYITGFTQGGLDGQPYVGGNEVFVVKYNTSGEKQWTRLSGIGPGKVVYGNGISVDSDGNTYVTGYTDGALDGETQTGTDDVFVIKYNTSGEKQWTRLLGASGAQTRGQGISVDSNADCYVTGSTNGELDGQTLTGTQDLFVVKYNTSGEKQWTKLLGAAGASTNGQGISVDSDGSSYVGGYTSGDLDGQTLTGNTDMFVVKYNTSGTKQWTKLLGSAGAGTSGQGVSVDSDGNSYVGGYTNGDLDGQPVFGTASAFVTKHNTSGERQWTRLLGVPGSATCGYGIAIDSIGISYVAGYTGGNLDGQTLTGYRDMIVTTVLNK